LGGNGDKYNKNDKDVEGNGDKYNKNDKDVA
jgi:hypothetical protein